MGTGKLAWVIVCAAVIVPGVGCASDNRPAYVKPELTQGDGAVLKGGGGTYIVAVDGTKVGGAGVMVSTFGGNDTVITPGEHEVEVAIQGTNFQRMVRFKYTFLAGHTYKFGAASIFDTRVKVTDQTTKESTVIQ